MGKTYFILLAIVFFAVGVRFVDLGVNPPSMYGDELTAAYDGYSILKTGRDQLGNFLPLTFPLSDGRGGGYIYFSLPFIAVFGPSELGVRALSALSGVGMVIVVFFLAKKLFNEKVGLLSSLVMAVVPWSINISRGGFEANFAAFLFLGGVTAFLYARKVWVYVVSAVLLGLTILTYHSFKVVTPLFLPILFWYQGYFDRHKFKGSIRMIGVFIGVFVLFLAVWLFQIGQGSEARLTGQNIFSSTDINRHISEQIGQDVGFSKLYMGVARVLSNKFVEYGKILADNYLSNFSTLFLFTRGDLNPRHNMGASGQLLLVFAPLLVLSAVELVRWKRQFLFLCGLLVISAVPGSIVTSAHALRSVGMMVPLVVLCGVGAYVVWVNFRKSLLVRLGALALVVLGCVQFVLFANNIFFISDNKFKGFWAYEAKEASLLARDNMGSRDYVWLSDRIDGVKLAFPVYAVVDPWEVIGQNRSAVVLDGVEVKKFGNVYIGNLFDAERFGLLDKLGKRYMIIGNWDEMAMKEKLDSVGKNGMVILKRY